MEREKKIQRDRMRNQVTFTKVPSIFQFIFIAYPCLTHEGKGEISRLIDHSFRIFLSENKL